MTRCVIRRHLLVLIVCAALVFKSLRSMAQDDYAGYRREYYREDDHRMSIDTDTAGFDVGLGSHVRVTGLFVNDAISGATPNGLPQFDKWKPADYNYYYQPLYQSQYSIELANYTNGMPYDGSIPYSQYYSQATNYAAGAAYNDATPAAQNAYSNHLQYLAQNGYLNNSSKVPTTLLHDHRRAFSLGVPVSFGIHTITPQYAYSSESDYHSFGLALNYSTALNKKNTTLNAGWAHTMDRVRFYQGFAQTETWQGKISDDILVGINQLLTPKSYFTADFTFGQEYGYLDDPYREVILLDMPFVGAIPSIGENRPRKRTKEIIYLSYSQFFDALNGSAEVGYRFFHDSFGIFAQTAEVAWHQKITKYLVFTPALRYYYQTAAHFYTIGIADSGNIPQYYSSDYRLSEFNSWSVSGNLTVKVQKHFSIDLGYMRYVMQGLDGVTSQSAYPTANTYTVGGRIWF